MRNSISDANAVVELYFLWLCNQITVEYGDKTFWMLARRLFFRDFEYFVPNDDNRAFEGMKLREEFCNETNMKAFSNFLDDVPCNMLELMIALSKDCEHIMADQETNKSMKDWFWTLCHNSGLDRYPDTENMHLWSADSVDEILTKVCERTYHRNGHDGFFPLDRHKKDQRKVELWYQMNEYLIQKFYVDDET